MLEVFTLAERPAVKAELMPQGAIVCIAPHIRMVEFKPALKMDKSTPIQLFDIPLPWTVYRVNVGGYGPSVAQVLGCAKRPAKGDPLLSLPCSNMSATTGGNCAAAITKVGDTFEAILLNAIGSWWSQRFNYNMGVKGDFANWEMQTLKNVVAYLKPSTVTLNGASFPDFVWHDEKVLVPAEDAAEASA